MAGDRALSVERVALDPLCDFLDCLGFACRRHDAGGRQYDTSMVGQHSKVLLYCFDNRVRRFQLQDGIRPADEGFRLA